MKLQKPSFSVFLRSRLNSSFQFINEHILGLSESADLDRPAGK